MDILLGILGLLAGCVVIVLVAWFIVMLIHLLVDVIPDRITDIRLARIARQHRRG